MPGKYLLPGPAGDCVGSIAIAVVLMLMYANKVNAFDFSAFDQAAQDSKKDDAKPS